MKSITDISKGSNWSERTSIFSGRAHLDTLTGADVVPLTLSVPRARPSLVPAARPLPPAIPIAAPGAPVLAFPLVRWGTAPGTAPGASPGRRALPVMPVRQSHRG